MKKAAPQVRRHSPQSTKTDTGCLQLMQSAIERCKARLTDANVTISRKYKAGLVKKVRFAGGKNEAGNSQKPAMRRVFTGYAASFYGLCSEFRAYIHPIKKERTCTSNFTDTQSEKLLCINQITPLHLLSDSTSEFLSRRKRRFLIPAGVISQFICIFAKLQRKARQTLPQNDGNGGAWDLYRNNFATPYATHRHHYANYSTLPGPTAGAHRPSRFEKLEQPGLAAVCAERTEISRGTAVRLR